MRRRILPIIGLVAGLLLTAAACGNGSSPDDTDPGAASVTTQPDANVSTTDSTVAPATTSPTVAPTTSTTPTPVSTIPYDNDDPTLWPEAVVNIGDNLRLCNTTYPASKCETADEGFALTDLGVKQGDVVKLTCRVIGDDVLIDQNGMPVNPDDPNVDVVGNNHFWYWIWIMDGSAIKFEGFLDEAHLTDITVDDVAVLDTCPDE
jgi:hypothetical protein